MAHALTGFLNDKNHPLRSALTDEMHVRRFPSFSAPMRLTQLVMFTGEQQLADARKHVESLCAKFGVAAPKGKYFAVRLGELQLVWEHHTEFSTYSFIKTGPFEHPFDEPVLLDVPHDWVKTMPGQVLRATQVALLDRHAPEPDEALLSQYFNRDDLMSCDVSNGEARIWSDFKLNADGMGRLLIRDQALQSGGDTARLVQRLQELGNYRNMAMLGLPVAQSLTPTLSALEQRLAALTHEIAAGSADEGRLLEDISVLSADLARVTADTRYRMTATRAYAQLVSDRLRSLDVRRVGGYQTLIDFTERRLTPAERTCDSFAQRLEDLSLRASWASSLMRTRIETTLERQSTALLHSMNHRTHMQLRLQQTVEGLSVLAISYYVVGLLGYAAKPLGHWWQWDPSLLLGIAAPVVVAGAWYAMRRLRYRVSGSSDASNSA
jgi:uncharacterized membrane-anchored protein